ncbi:MAG: hypothetical protein FWG63_00180 [Defluviitaleaceae bacterium]|nr:hypothetical protein [Defluviitaleaceae bacterium]
MLSDVKSNAATRAKNKYRDKTYDQINIVVKKGKKETLKAHAATKGESLNGFVNRAIDEAVTRDNKDDIVARNGKTFANETEYLTSIPGMDESIIKGMNTPVSECVPMEEVFPDV